MDPMTANKASLVWGYFEGLTPPVFSPSPFHTGVVPVEDIPW